MSRSEERARVLAFLDTIRRPEQGLDEIGESDSLVDAGLIDSLALLEIVSFLERDYGIDFAERGIDPGELATIGGILALVRGAGG